MLKYYIIETLIIKGYKHFLINSFINNFQFASHKAKNILFINFKIGFRLFRVR